MGKNKCYPLSHPQKRVWYTELLNPGLSLSNMAGLVILPSLKVDMSLLEASINLVISRHDSLRLRMLEAGPYELKQYFANHQYKTLDIVRNNVRRWALEKSKEAFNLIDHDLYYFALFEEPGLGAGYYFLYHHIICDALSISLINKEIYENYCSLLEKENRALVDGVKGNNPLEPVSYLEFLDRDRSYLDSEKYKEDQKFWHSEYTSPPDPFSFNKVSKGQTLATDRMIYSLGQDLSDKIQVFCKGHNISLFRFFLSLLYLYLGALYDKKDLVISIGHHNRISKRERQLVGMTVSTLPVRVRLSDDMEFLSFLDQVSSKVSLCLSHQAYPFDLLAGFIRSKAIDPKQLLLVSFNQIPSLTEDYRVQRFSPGADPAALNIKLNPNQRAKDAPIELAVDYRLDLFSYCEIEKMQGRLKFLLSQVLEKPGLLLRDIDIVPAEEKRDLLARASGEIIDYNKDKLIHQLIEERAIKRPDKLALVCGKDQYSFKELSQRSNQLARVLRERGIRPNSLVAIMMERSCDYLIGLLAILKAGGAFIPIDPSLPDQRLRLILREARPALLLSHCPLKERALSLTGPCLNPDKGSRPCPDQQLYQNMDGSPNPRPDQQVYQSIEDGPSSYLDSQPRQNTDDDYIPSTDTYPFLSIDEEYIYGMDHRSLENINCLSDLAYLIYTSGSSGKPKGVKIRHENLLNFCQWAKDFYELDEGDIHAAYCNFAFDVSIGELLAPLMLGSTVHIIHEDLRLSIRLLNDYLNRHRITIATLPTRVGVLFMEEENRSLRLLTVCGEKLNYFKDQSYQIVNAYGPSEATIYATAFKVDKNYDNIPIGYPISNSWAYVVDSEGRLLPQGSAGELWLAGENIGSAYLNDQALTDKSFISNPFKSCDLNPIVYKTGDLVRQGEDGRLEFLGRLDQQVKIRGIRIETAEIEIELLKNPRIRKALVVKSDFFKKESLLAFIEADQGIDLAGVKREIGLVLPPYMIPDRLIRLEELPMTANGKVDYRALETKLEQLKEDEKKAFVKERPKTEAEKKLSLIWERLLDIKGVKAGDSFFDLGGDSLTIMVLSLKIEEAFKVEIPPHLLFKENTLEKQATLIESRARPQFTGDALSRIGQAAEPFDNSLNIIELAGSPKPINEGKGPIFCIHDITGELLSYAFLADFLGQTQPVYGIRPQKNRKKENPSIEELATSYIETIKTIQPEGPYSLIGYSSGGAIAYEMARQLYIKNDKLALLVLVDTPNYSKYPVGNIYIMAIKNVLPWLTDLPIRRLPYLAWFAVKKVLRMFSGSEGYSPSRARAAINSYQPKPYPGRLLLFRTSWKTKKRGQDLGWEGKARLGLEIIPASGNHISVMNKNNSRQLAEQIIGLLQKGDKDG